MREGGRGRADVISASNGDTFFPKNGETRCALGRGTDFRAAETCSLRQAHHSTDKDISICVYIYIYIYISLRLVKIIA